jgi:hypothetical protein
MTEERLRERLRDVAGTAAESHDDYDRLWEEGVAKRRRRVLGVAVGSLAVGGIVVAAGFAGIAAYDSGATDDGAPTVSQPSPTAWQQLTGKAVGEALGLDPLSTAEGKGACEGTKGFTEYVKGMGFCYDPADLGITSEVEAELLILQIWGYERTPALVEYADVDVQLQELGQRMSHNNSDPTLVQQWRDLAKRKQDLGGQLVKHE